MDLLQKVNKIIENYNNLKEKLSEPFADQKEFAALSKEFSDIEENIDLIKKYKNTYTEIINLSEELKKSGLDHDMRQMIEDELHDLKSKLPELEHELQIALLEKDPNDEKNVIIEIRAGTGGDEAGLFAHDLLRMYQRYAEIKKWKFEMISISENDFGSLKEATASISGKNIYGEMKFESGVHRVQRVPLTEASGRIHTSTATVAVMPEVEEFDVNIDPKDIRIDFMRASGAGGQHVNKTDSAVRITHFPTGIVVVQQDERSQHMNKAKAFKILRARIYDQEMQKRNSAIAADRKSKIGTGERSERIRTYNFPQGRVTDHRINLTLYKIEQIMNGELDELTEALKTASIQEKIAN